MKKRIFGFLLLFSSLGFAQANPAGYSGILPADAFARWTVPGNGASFSWPLSTCQVTANNVTFPAFTVGTPIRIVDTGTPTHSETVTVITVTQTGSGCSIATTPQTYKHLSFYLTSGTFGLQEAINYAGKLPGTVLLTPQWSALGGTNTTIANVTGQSGVSLTDNRPNACGIWQWGGSGPYTLTACSSGGGGPAGTLGEIQTYAQGNVFGAEPYIVFADQFGHGETGANANAAFASCPSSNCGVHISSSTPWTTTINVPPAPAVLYVDPGPLLPFTGSVDAMKCASIAGGCQILGHGVIDGTGSSGGANCIHLLPSNGTTIQVRCQNFAAGYGLFDEGANAVSLSGSQFYDNLDGVHLDCKTVTSVTYAANAVSFTGGDSQIAGNTRWGWFNGGSACGGGSVSTGNYVGDAAVLEYNGSGYVTTTSSGNYSASSSPVTITVGSCTGLNPSGSTGKDQVLIDSGRSTIGVNVETEYVNSCVGNSLVVAQLLNPHNGSITPFPISSLNGGNMFIQQAAGMVINGAYFEQSPTTKAATEILLGDNGTQCSGGSCQAVNTAIVHTKTLTDSGSDSSILLANSFGGTIFDVHEEGAIHNGLNIEYGASLNLLSYDCLACTSNGQAGNVAGFILNGLGYDYVGGGLHVQQDSTFFGNLTVAPGKTLFTDIIANVSSADTLDLRISGSDILELNATASHNINMPAFGGGGLTQCLYADNNGDLQTTGAACGTGSPGAPQYSVQYNTGTAFGGDNSFQFNPTSKLVTMQSLQVGGTTFTLSGPLGSSCPSPASGSVILCGNSGVSALQVSNNGNSYFTVGTGSGTVTSIGTTSPITGGTITTTGTIACPTCGVTGSPLSQFASTTSAQLLATLSNPTGTGLSVFGTSPTLITPQFNTYEVRNDTGTSDPAFTSSNVWNWNRSDMQRARFNDTVSGTNGCNNSGGTVTNCNTLGQAETGAVSNDIDQVQAWPMWTLQQLANTDVQDIAVTHPKVAELACVGDSDTAGYSDGNSWCTYMASSLRDLYGDGGPGWSPAVAACASLGWCNASFPHNFAMPGASVVSNGTAGDFTEEFNGSDLSVNSPDDTAVCVVNGNTHSDSITVTGQDVTQGVIYTPVGAGLGSFTWAIDGGSTTSVNETTGTNWATNVMNAGGTTQLAEGVHQFKLSVTSDTKTCFFGVDLQNNTITSHQGFGIRVHKLASSSEYAQERNSNPYLGAQVYDSTTSNCQTSSNAATTSLCVSGFLNMYTVNERNPGNGNRTPAQAASDWATLSATERTNLKNADVVWIPPPDAQVNSSNGANSGSQAQYAAAMRSMVQAHPAVRSASAPAPAYGYINMNHYVGDYSSSAAPFCWNNDNIHLTDSCKEQLGWTILGKLVPFLPRYPIAFSPKYLSESGPINGTSTPVQFKFAKFASAFNVYVVAGTSETATNLLVCVQNCSTVGSNTKARFAYAGPVPVVFDGTAAVLGHYVQASTTSAGMAHDSGSSVTSPPAAPSSGCQNYPGVVTKTTSGTSGQVGEVDLSQHYFVCAGATSAVAPLSLSSGGAVSLQNSTPANVTAAYGTDTAYFTASGGASTNHDLISGDANGGIADNGSGVQVSSGASGTFTAVGGSAVMGNGVPGIIYEATTSYTLTGSDGGTNVSTLSIDTPAADTWYEITGGIAQSNTPSGCSSSAGVVSMLADYTDADNSVHVTGTNNLPTWVENSVTTTGISAGATTASPPAAPAAGNIATVISKTIHVKASTAFTIILHVQTDALTGCSPYPQFKFSPIVKKL